MCLACSHHVVRLIPHTRGMDMDWCLCSAAGAETVSPIPNFSFFMKNRKTQLHITDIRGPCLVYALHGRVSGSTASSATWVGLRCREVPHAHIRGFPALAVLTRTRKRNFEVETCGSDRFVRLIPTQALTLRCIPLPPGLPHRVTQVCMIH